jgi:hypothetical protein
MGTWCQYGKSGWKSGWIRLLARLLARLLEALLEALSEGFPEDFLQGSHATAIQPGFNESPQHTRRIATVCVSLASTQPRAAAGAEDHPASHPRSCPEGATKLRRLATGESW